MATSVMRRPDETLYDFAKRFLEKLFGPAQEIPCLDKTCRFYQDASRGGVEHCISDHEQLAEIQREEDRWQR